MFCFVGKMLDRKLTILYGSQTGTAQDLAEQIWRESKIYHFRGTVNSMDNYDVKNLIHEKIVVFVCATTGQGDEPDNMKSFWKFLLRKSLPANSLSGLKFGVLGLGDSSYSKFNFVAKRLNRRLTQLGATQLNAIGLCDDQHDLGASAVSAPWIRELWEKLDRVNPLPNGLAKLDVCPRFYKWNIKVIDEDKENDVQMFNLANDIVFVDSNLDKPFETIVVENMRTTDFKHFQDVRMITMKRTDVMNWSPGDVFNVRPENSDEKVKALFDLFAEHNLQLYPETVVSIEEIDDGKSKTIILKLKKKGKN